MNLSTLIVLLIVVGIVALVIRTMIHDKKTGKGCGGCNGGCAGCGGGCHSEEEK